MSEIRSISEGSFVLGDTNNLTFEAGSGIKITEPSEGTVRIANDETVLWSGLASPSDFPLSLSESLSNFEKVEFTWIPRYQGDYGSPTVCALQETSGYGGTLRYTLIAPYWNASTTWLGWWFLSTTDNQTKLTSVKNAFGNPQTTNAVTDGLLCKMVRVIGINRKTQGGI